MVMEALPHPGQWNFQKGFLQHLQRQQETERKQLGESMEQLTRGEQEATGNPATGMCPPGPFLQVETSGTFLIPGSKGVDVSSETS